MKTGNTLRSLSWIVGVALMAACMLTVYAAEPRRIDISVTEMGFSPDKIAVKKDEAVSLVFTRKTDKTCAKDVVIQVSDKEKIQKTLPLNTPITVATKFVKAGDVRFACGMNMVSGVIQVQ